MATIENPSGNTISSSLAHSALDDALFGHPDDTSELDRYDDAVAEVAKLQELGPVVRGIGTRFGHFALPNIMISPRYDSQPSFATVTWEAAREVYMNPAVFSSSCFAETTGKFWGPALAIMDPPEHTKFRSIMQLAFLPKRVAAWEESIIKPMMRRRFDAIKGKGRADLVRDLTVHFPYDIVGTVAGFNPEDIAYVGECFKRIQQANIDPERAFQAGNEIKAYAKRLIDARRREPKDDLVSAMAEAEIGGKLIPDDNFVAMVVHLMQGGIDTVFRQSSNLIQLLLTHPDQFEIIKANRALIPRAVEEGLRYGGVASSFPRVAMQDTELLGVAIPKGSIVWNIHAVINRDPARWENPNKFDVTREPQMHMAFGNGPHMCIGMHLARFELARFLEYVIDDFPNLRWQAGLESIPKITGWSIRGVTTLPVEWDIP